MPPPCKIHWCDALATRGVYCAVHAVTPTYDPRDYYERISDGSSVIPKLKADKPRVKRTPDPVDARPLMLKTHDV
jgi:hypothetical protein